jgi:hypothetical protein
METVVDSDKLTDDLFSGRCFENLQTRLSLGGLVKLLQWTGPASDTAARAAVNFTGIVIRSVPTDF